MDRINQVIRSISGHDNKTCYHALRQAVGYTLEQLPMHPQMKDIAREAARRSGNPDGEKAAAKALGRAAADVWEYGCRANLERIFGRPLLEAPTPKSLVWTLAEYIRETEGQPEEPYTVSGEQLRRLLELLKELPSGR